jgi:hypothetical protein
MGTSQKSAPTYIVLVSACPSSVTADALRGMAELGYDQIVLSPRANFWDWRITPRAAQDPMATFKAGMWGPRRGPADLLQPMGGSAHPF